MKKTIISLATAAIGLASFTQAADELSISTTFGFESEYVFRGLKLDQQALQPGVDVEYGNFYGGVWGSAGISSGRDRDATEMNFYAGYAFALDEMVTLDFGGTYYYYPEDVSGYTREVYFGAAFDNFLEPAGYIYYDFDLKGWTFELSAGHSIEVAENTSIDFSGHLGYQRFSRSGDLDARFNHYYAGVSADLTYAFSDSASFSIGPRVSANRVTSGGDGNAVRNLLFDGSSGRDLFWWGASFTAGF